MAAAYPRTHGSGNRNRVASPLLGKVAGLLHGFTTRWAGDFSGPEAARGLQDATGARALRLLRQVHGVRVERVVPSRAGDEPGGGAPRSLRPQADAWAGNPGPEVLLGVLTADCVPVLLCHPASRTLALAHAGWRGAVDGVSEAALEAMGVSAEETLAALGPAIGPCCYQVGKEVADAGGTDSPRFSPWAGEPGRYRLDLPGLVRDRLVAAGVPPGAVDVLPYCTACRADLFYSHRRGADLGRMCAYLGWAPERGEGWEGGRT
ncbi:MAG: polyphenol oxidase family protein [Thermodesulfobacteriota bacterium]